MIIGASKKIKDSFVPFQANITYDYEEIGGIECEVLDVIPPKSKNNKNSYWAFLVKIKHNSIVEKFLTPAVRVADDFKMPEEIIKKTKCKMKLFVFHNVLRGYSGGMAFAIAESKESALDQIAKSMGLDSFSDLRLRLVDRAREFENSDPEILPLNSPVAFHIYGSA